MPPSKKKFKPREIQAVSNSNSTSKLKKKIRDLERLLKKPGLQADKFSETERALKSVKYQLESAQQNQHVKTMSKKYQMVRFFETKKSARRLKQAVKKLQTDDENNNNKKAKKQVDECEIDFYYVRTYPIDQKYVSLYPTDDKDASKEEREEFRNKVKKRIDNGELPVGIDEEGSIALRNDKSMSTNTVNKTNVNKNSNNNDKPGEIEDEQEDDDFFD